MNDIELIKSNKFADNDFRSSAIATGCKLWECKTDEEKIARVRLYRDWRTSKIYGKETKPCFEMACKGEAVPVVDMFVGLCNHETSILLESIGALDKSQCTWVCGKVYWTITEGLTTREIGEKEALGLLPAENDNARYYGQADAV